MGAVSLTVVRGLVHKHLPHMTTNFDINVPSTNGLVLIHVVNDWLRYLSTNSYLNGMAIRMLLSDSNCPEIYLRRLDHDILPLLNGITLCQTQTEPQLKGNYSFC